MLSLRARWLFCLAGPLGGALLTVNSSATQTPAPFPQRPNIIMYLADDVGREAFGSYAFGRRPNGAPDAAGSHYEDGG
jgi:hypothetical protein